MKTTNVFNVDSILKVTKNVIQSSDNFNRYYLEQNDTLYTDQIPLLNANTSESKSLILINPNETNNISKSNNITNTSFRSIRRLNERPNNIPKLCPLYNDQGDLMPEIALNSKISFRTSYNFFNNPIQENLGTAPMKISNRNFYNFSNIHDAYNNFEKDIFFNNDIYNHLNFNFKEIYGQKYFDNIKILVENLKNEKNKDYLKENCIFEKNYEFGKKKKRLNLQLKSLFITFEDLDNNNKKDIKKKNPEVIIPFILLPIFYYKGDEIFKKLLTLIIKFDKDYEKIELDYKELSLFLNNNEEFNGLKEDLQNMISNENLPLIQPHLQVLQDNNEYVNIKYEEEKKIVYNKRNHFIYPPIQKNPSFLNYNQFSFIWLTPKKRYKVTINLPLISFILSQNAIRIQQYIDFELLFYLIEHNFSNWDFYIMKYLSSFKKFRILLENLSSHKSISNIQFFLINPKIKFYSFDDWEINNIYTNENLISSNLIFQPIYVNVTVFNNEKYLQDQYKVHFNFYQMSKFVQIEKYLNKVLFFIKFLNITSEENNVSYYYGKLNEFNVENWVNDVKKFNLGGHFKEKNEKNEKTIIEFEGPSSNIKIKIELNQSIIILKNTDKGKDVEKYYSVSDDTLNNISNESDFNNYSSILIKNLTKENEIIQNDVRKKGKNKEDSS